MSDVAAFRADTRSNSELARVYGVSKPTIAAIRLPKTWCTDGLGGHLCAQSP